ncbi:MAG: hypothetical protein HQ582_05405, partial [Planctomycetes bacterium]|nr:hypothetical protein [Planctomycetota bacterium]
MTRIAVATFALLAVCAPAGGQDPIDVGSRRELLVDDHLIETLTGEAALRLHRPVPREVAIVHDEPWEGNISYYHTVFRDGDRCRMYYRGAHHDWETKRVTHQVVCYAESQDGIRWTKPELGIVDLKGSKKNSIIW